MARVTLYSRPACGLCHDARREMEASVPEVEIDEIDVDSDPSLRERYGDHVPVAVSGTRELFRHRFDPECVRALRAD